MPNKDKEPPPEGPEVKKFTSQLSDVISEKVLTDVVFISGRYADVEPIGYKGFAAKLPCQVSSVSCKGKLIYFTMSNPNLTIWSTLGLTGSWSNTANEYSRIMLAFSDGSHVFYNDIVNYGSIRFSNDKSELTKKLSSIGPDMLMEDISNKDFIKILRKHNSKSIAEVLMNQKIIAGVGNYLKAECLYFSKISPKRKVAALSDDELSTLNVVIKTTIRDAYQHGGSTLKTYADMYGDVGNFSERLVVYKKDKDPLGNKVISEITSDKRTTWWVPAIQK